MHAWACVTLRPRAALDGQLIRTGSHAANPSSNAAASAPSNQASQPGSSSLRRGGIGLCAIVLGAAYVARAAGDLAENGLVWLSPIGWAQATRAYVDERWWPLLLSMAVAALLVTIAVALSARRDLGAGISPERRGPSAASRSLGSWLGLVFRLQRGSVLGWGAVIVLFGVGYGTFLGEAEEFASENEAVRDFLGADASTVLSEAFAAAIALMIALLATAFAIQSALRLSGEEIGPR